MALFNQRKRLARLAEAESQGSSFWTRSFDDPVRVKVAYAFRDAAPSGRQAHAAYARNLILKDEGLITLTGRNDPDDDFWAYISESSDEMFPTVVEAMDAACAVQLQYIHPDRWRLRQEIAQIFSGHRIAYDFIDGRMIEFDSRELHQEVVEPALRLLSGNNQWEPVERAFQKALHELSKGDPADAITDSATALQEALVLLGCQGNSLGPLARDARKRGLLAAHDQILADSIMKIIDWVQADRSSTGDAHNAAPATRDDAWFAVHVVGALILRLAGSRRA